MVLRFLQRVSYFFMTIRRTDELNGEYNQHLRGRTLVWELIFDLVLIPSCSCMTKKKCFLSEILLQFLLVNKGFVSYITW